MKYYLGLFAMLLLLSCSKDDKSEYNPNPQSTIYGKWYQKEKIVDGTTFPYDDHESCGKDYFEFYGLNQIRSMDVRNCVEEIDWEGNFVKNNNVLTISNGSVTRTVEILELTNYSLILQYDFDGDGDGENEHYIEKFDR